MYVAIVSSGCCICFAIATHVFSNVLGVFASVSDVCCKCFSCFERMLHVFHMYVSKVDRDAPHVAMCPTYHNLLLQLLERHACAWGAKGWSTARRWAGKAKGDGDRGACNPTRGKQGSSAAGVEGNGVVGKHLERRGGEGRGKQEAWGAMRVVPCLYVQQALVRAFSRPGHHACPSNPPGASSADILSILLFALNILRLLIHYCLLYSCYIELR